MCQLYTLNTIFIFFKYLVYSYLFAFLCCVCFIVSKLFSFNFQRTQEAMPREL